MSAVFENRVRIIIAIVLVFAVLVGIIFANAFTANLQYEINILNKQIQESERTIQNLNVKIKQANNVNNLELKAFEMGLIYPDFTQIVYINDKNEERIQEFSLALVESIYK